MNVGFRLYREVLDFAPADVTPGELVVALVLADDANDMTRKSWIPLELLCHRARQKPSTVRKHLAMLAGRGLEFRVSHGTGKDGRQVFATRSHATDYYVPDVLKGALSVAPFEPPEPVDNSPNGATDVAPYGEGKALRNELKALRIGAKGATDVAPLPSIPSVTTSTEELPAVTPPVEGSRLPVENNGTSEAGISGIELAAWQAVVESRRHA